MANPIEQMVILKDNFEFCALFFGVFWAIFNRIWWVVFTYLLMHFIVGIMAEKSIISPLGAIFIQLFFNFTLALFATDIQEMKLKKEGYELSYLTCGKNQLEAELRLFDNNLNSIVTKEHL
jgi:hypothetical protein